MLNSHRSFLNDRTDLTPTEVSPREMDKQGKVVKIKAKCIKPTSELKSIKMLNINGRVQTKRHERIIQSLQ